MIIDFPDPRDAPDECDLLAVGAWDLDGFEVVAPDDLDWPKLTKFGSRWDSEVIIEAYRRGLFPMPFDVDDQFQAIGWWSPAKRAIFYPHRIRLTRSLRKDLTKFTVTIDSAFESVVRECGDPSRPHGWIDDNVVAAYVDLHQQGHAHSVEVWQDSVLVGGLYGLAVGGIFAGESMFHKVTNASKVALVHLGRWLDDGSGRVIDSQWMTDHLASMGAIEITRDQYCDLLADKLAIDPPKPWV